jgi:hypothetical protein
MTTLHLIDQNFPYSMSDEWFFGYYYINTDINTFSTSLQLNIGFTLDLYSLLEESSNLFLESNRLSIYNFENKIFIGYKIGQLTTYEILKEMANAMYPLFKISKRRKMHNKIYRYHQEFARSQEYAKLHPVPKLYNLSKNDKTELRFEPQSICLLNKHFQTVKAGSQKNINFICYICNHIFKKNIKNMIILDQWCPYCSTNTLKLCEDDCNWCFNKSVASLEQSNHWNSEKNDTSPRMVVKNSHTSYWWICNICKHDIKVKPCNIVQNNQWCGYCSNNFICGKEDCDFCKLKSFASYPKHIYWNYDKNKKTPIQVAKTSSCQKYHFICENKHFFSSTLDNIVLGGTWCPDCRLKTEAIFYTYFGKKYIIERQFSDEWSTNPESKYKLKYDFLFKELKIIVEVDGRQHCDQVGPWTDPKEVNARDRFKIQKAIENGFTIIHLCQEEIWKDNYDWINEVERVLHRNNKPELIILTNNEKLRNALLNGL